MSLYFESFPAVLYNGTYATDLTLRAKFIEASKKINLTFYPYTVTEGERPDQIAYHYYDDSSYSWLVFLSNNIIDPYFEWPMSNDIFAKHILKKYGSVYDSQQKIVKYVSNWYDDDRSITAAAYRALPSNVKKYWTPETASAGNRTYVRTRDELVVSTNTIYTLNVANSSIFAVGTRVQYVSGSSIIATGEVTMASNNVIMVQHVVGTFGANPSYNLVAADGTTTKIQSVANIHHNIPTNELSYWSSVSAFDEEQQKNETRKNIVLLDRELKTQVARELHTLITNG